MAEVRALSASGSLHDTPAAKRALQRARPTHFGTGLKLQRPLLHSESAPHMVPSFLQRGQTEGV